MFIYIFLIVKSYSIQSTDSLDITPNIHFIIPLDSSFITKYEIIYGTKKQYEYIENKIMKTEVFEHSDIFVYIYFILFYFCYN